MGNEASTAKAAADIQHAFSDEVWSPYKNGTFEIAQQIVAPVMPIMEPVIAPIVNTIAPDPPLPPQLIEPPPEPLPQPPPVADSQMIPGVDNQTALLVALGLTAAVLLLD